LTRTIGLPLSALPLEPGLGRALLAAATTYTCAAEMLTIAAMLSVPSFWAPSYGDKKALEAAKGAFAVAEGDLATCLNVYQAWVDNKRSQQW
jgi:pre-mRNA-splicing factor ATP-dependent RNA helicase DHX38/PRP16